MTIECTCEYDSGVIMTVDPECPIHKPGGTHPAIVPSMPPVHRGATPPPRKKGERGTGRIISEEMAEGDSDPMTEMFARQIEDQMQVNFSFIGRRVRAVRTMDNVGWERRAIILDLDNGETVRISGQELKVQVSRCMSDEQAWEELERES